MTSHGDFYAPNTIQQQAQRVAARRADDLRFRGIIAGIIIAMIVATAVFYAWQTSRMTREREYYGCLAYAQSDVDALRCDLRYQDR